MGNFRTVHLRRLRNVSLRVTQAWCVGHLTALGEIRTVLPFCHTESGRPVFLCRSTTCRTAFFNAASALSCKDILFFIYYFAPFLKPFLVPSYLETPYKIKLYMHDHYDGRRIISPGTGILLFFWPTEFVSGTSGST